MDEPRWRSPIRRALQWRGGIAPALALAALHWLLAFSSVREKSTTCDEPIYIAGGLSCWLFNDYRLHPENGNLPQRIAALPLVFDDGIVFPPLNTEQWRTADHYGVGVDLLYGQGNDADRILLRARAAILLLNFLTALLVFQWSRELFGVAGGLLSLTMAVFCPTMLGYGSIVMSDMAAALGFLLAVRYIWKAMHEVTPMLVATGGLAAGVMCISKMSAPLLAPMAAIMLAVRLISRAPLPVRFRNFRREISPRPQRAAVLAGVLIAQALIAWAMIWAAYGFRYRASAEAGEDFPLERRMSWEQLLDRCGGSPGGEAFRGAIIFCRDNRLLPEAFLWGMAYTYRFAQMRSAYMNGEYSVTGWRSFFPYCFAVKTPIPAMALIALAAAGGMLAPVIRRSRAPEGSGAGAGAEGGCMGSAPPGCAYPGGAGADGGGGHPDSGRPVADVPGRDMPGLAGAFYRAAPLWALLIVYWAAAITSNLNIGHRHLLPVYPPIYILCGAAAVWLRERPRVLRAATAICAVLLLSLIHI
ncbi:MAG: hypothetical protein N3A38_01205, partial [Planctomycetota bacterium]|nr:hypothetical protein [Planctomycetota bacterium]